MINTVGMKSALAGEKSFNVQADMFIICEWQKNKYNLRGQSLKKNFSESNLIMNQTARYWFEINPYKDLHTYWPPLQKTGTQTE